LIDPIASATVDGWQNPSALDFHLEASKKLPSIYFEGLVTPFPALREPIVQRSMTQTLRFAFFVLKRLPLMFKMVFSIWA
jgi:hypothetical protein